MTAAGSQWWAGHHEHADRPWLAPLLLVGLWAPLGAAVWLFGWLAGFLTYLALAVAVGAVVGGWSYLLEGWDRLRVVVASAKARWSR